MNRYEKLQHLRDRARAISSADPSKEFVSGGNVAGCRFAECIISICTLENEIRQDIYTFPNEKWREVLTMRFIQNKTPKDIATTTGMSLRQIYRIIAEMPKQGADE